MQGRKERAGWIRPDATEDAAARRVIAFQGPVVVAGWAALVLDREADGDGE
jgi:hypothetical protein